MKTINFSYNWNNGKLNNKFFTSLRLSDRFEVGEQVQAKLKVKDNIIGENKYQDLKVTIVRAKKELKLDQINEFITGLDTGYSVEETKNILKKMYPNVNWQTQKIYLYLFETIK